MEVQPVEISKKHGGRRGLWNEIVRKHPVENQTWIDSWRTWLGLDGQKGEDSSGQLGLRRPDGHHRQDRTPWLFGKWPHFSVPSVLHHCTYRVLFVCFVFPLLPDVYVPTAKQVSSELLYNIQKVNFKPHFSCVLFLCKIIFLGKSFCTKHWKYLRGCNPQH